MKIIVQGAVLLSVCLVAQAVEYALPFGFPASVIGMVLLFVLLQTKVLPPERIDTTASFLTRHLALLFIPATVEVIEVAEVLTQNLWPILVICLCTTPLVFWAAGKTVQWAMGVMVKLGGDRV